MALPSLKRWFRACILLIHTANAIPRMVFPFNSQVPPVARIGEPYSFTFSPTTFANDATALDYSLQNAPAWLNIDGGSRTLYGTPGSADAGFPAFSIIAFDSTGRTSMPSTLVVVASDHESPSADVDVSSVLNQAGRLSNAETLLVLPKVAFTFTFPQSTFKSGGSSLTYYATLADHTPLPSWLVFEAATLRFSGTAPVLSASPQYFEVLLIATDVLGFATASISFSIVVSVHSFYFEEVESVVTAEPGGDFDLHDLREGLVLDGQPAKSDDITKAAAQSPKWLNFDQRSLTFDGKTPADFSDGVVSLQVWNRFGDIANKTIQLKVSTGLLSTNFPDLKAKAGFPFEYKFKDDLFTQQGLRVSANVGSASSWLHFDAATKTLTGKVPSDLKSPVQVEITAGTADGAKTDTRKFDIEVLASNSASPPSASARHTSSTSAATGGVFAATSTPESTNTGRTVGMVIGVVMAIVAVICFLVFVVWYRRFGRSGKDQSRSRKKRAISRPQYHDNDPWSAGIDDSDLEKGSDEFKRSTDRPPQIPTPNISPFKKTRRSQAPRFPTIMPVPPTPVVAQDTARRSHARGQSLASSTINNDDVRILDNINRSSWGYNGTRRPHDSMKLPAEIARRSKLTDLGAIVTPDNKRVSRYASSTRLSLGQTPRVISGSLPVKPRASGLGHGRSPSVRNSLSNLLQVQQQDRTPSYADSVTTHSTSVLFSPRTPAPPPRPSRQPSYLEYSQRRTPEYMQGEAKILYAQRPISRRAPHRSAFFSARAHSRGSSSSRKRGTILGLSTIHASPDLAADAGAGAIQSIESPEKARTGYQRHPATIGLGMDTYHPLRRNPTKTSEATVTTWRTLDTGNDVPQDLGPPPPVPDRHPAHKRWSSQFRARLSRPISGVPSESSRFADADEQPHTMSGANVMPLDDDDASVYSQSSHSVSVFHSATHSPERERPVTRGKIPVGGVRVPPSTEADTNINSIMNREHPRATIRRAASREHSETPQKRTPLARLRGAENRLSGGGSFGLDKITLRPARLKSSKGRRPVSVNDGFEDKIRSVKGSVLTAKTGSSKSRAMSMSPIGGGNECFL